MFSERWGAAPISLWENEEDERREDLRRIVTGVDRDGHRERHPQQADAAGAPHCPVGGAEPNYVPGRRGVDGADDEIRTRDIDLGKVALYQLSYIRMPSVNGAPNAT